MAEESRLTDEMAALQEEAAAASRQRRIRREAGANEDVATVTAAAPPGSPVATAAAAVGLNISLLYQTSRASLVAEIRELEAEVAQRTAPPRGEAAATTAGGREEVEARLAEAEAALERERGALAVQAKALQEETLQASPRPPPRCLRTRGTHHHLRTRAAALPRRTAPPCLASAHCPAARLLSGAQDARHPRAHHAAEPLWLSCWPIQRHACQSTHELFGGGRRRTGRCDRHRHRDHAAAATAAEQ